MLFLNHPLVRGRYLKTGHVHTLRAYRRQGEGLQPLVHGSRFKHASLGRGLVTLVKEIQALTPRSLAAYVKDSGFAAAKDWIAAYEKFNRGQRVLPAYVYEVRRPAKPRKRKAQP